VLRPHLFQQECLQGIWVTARPHQASQCGQPWVCGAINQPCCQQRLLVYLGLGFSGREWSTWRREEAMHPLGEETGGGEHEGAQMVLWR